MAHCLAKGINPKAVDHRPGEVATSLMKAVNAGNEKTAKTLASYMDRQALTYQNEKGLTALDMALAKHSIRLIEALRPFNPSPTRDRPPACITPHRHDSPNHLLHVGQQLVLIG